MMMPPDKPVERESALSRRRFVSLGAGAFALLALPAVPKVRRRASRRSLPVMGTVADLIVVDANERRAQAAIDAAIRELQWVERAMSHYSARSDVGRANASVPAIPDPRTR